MFAKDFWGAITKPLVPAKGLRWKDLIFSFFCVSWAEKGRQKGKT